MAYTPPYSVPSLTHTSLFFLFHTHTLNLQLNSLIVFFLHHPLIHVVYICAKPHLLTAPI